MQISGIQTPSLIQNPKLVEINKELQKDTVNFSEVLLDALNDVNRAQNESTEMGNKFLLGEIDNIHDVSIAGMKADLTINLAVEVTNKLLSSYNEIMRLQL